MTIHQDAPELTAAPPSPSPASEHRVRGSRPAALTLSVLRVALGFTFLWAFLDKTFGLGYATTSAKAWVNGGSPTRGFLSGVAAGPMESTFHSWAGDPWADWLFMLGLVSVGVALLLGVALRPAAAAGITMLALMWVAEWPLAKTTSAGEATMSTNPFIESHVISALVLIVLVACSTGAASGLGSTWSKQAIVRRHPWLT